MLTLEEFLRQHPFPSLEAARPAKGAPLHVSGLAGSGVSALIAAQFEAAKGNVLFVARDAKTAETVGEDLESWLGEERVLPFPGLDLKPYEWRRPFGHILEQRLATFEALYRGQRSVVVATLPTFLQKLSSPASLHLEILALEKGQRLDLEDFKSAILHMGFEEAAQVQDIGEYSVRGEIIDIYPYLLDNPVRLVLFGDEIESIKEFDIFTQRSVRNVDKVEIFPLDECCFSARELEEGLLKHADRFPGDDAFEAESHRLLSKRDLAGIHWQKAFFKDLGYTLLDFMGPDTAVVVDGADTLAGAVDKFQEEARAGYASAKADGRWVATPEELFLDRAGLERAWAKAPRLHLGRLSWEGPDSRTFLQEEQVRGGGGLQQVEDTLRGLADRGVAVYLMSPNPGQGERLAKLVADLPVEDVVVGHLGCGFVSRDDGVAIFTDHQIFNRFSRKLKRKKHKGGGVSIQDFESLSRGDYVVHRDYGIGKYVGVRRVQVGGKAVDCIILDYAGTDKLTLPVTDLEKLEKYGSKEGKEPALSKLGGKSWDQLKERTRKAIVRLAQELIELYAKRQVAPGFAFSPDSPLQAEFEKAFEYDLTPDQAKAVKDVKADMEKPRPMDRLICGDVGFGKTEVAMRAAFKAVLDKKQVCVLAPTTILAAQHFERFQERFSEWPARIDHIDRFRSPKEQKATLEALAKGELDIIVGTHRLLSADVKFKDLGLMVIDEEQKFGVKQKEKLKELRTEVDVLSMTATPIPRTLHMSMVGARDLSLIMTPPRNRLPIDTRVIFWDPKQVRDAIEMELARGGQVFFVHNRVADLHEWTAKVEGLVPHARVGMAHGQMDEVALEQIMAAFVNREYDVLVATAIIESGIDIPNVNTMIVNRAELFGLSSLYQLRGRVGRSAAKAYCLLVAPDSNRFTDDVKKRLYALEKFTDLGSGFQIAMRDLEFRGAGNLLGLEQSGHIEEVGFETYVRMLDEAVRELRGQKALPPLNPEVDFPEDAFIPEDYVEDGFQRVAIYQKLSRCAEPAEVDEMERELEDRFGTVPAPARALLRTILARVAAQKVGFQKVELLKNLLSLQFAPAYAPEGEALGALTAKFKRRMRFLNEKPLRVVVELSGKDGPERMAQAVEVLRGLV